MARMKVTKTHSADGKIPFNILKQHFEENSSDDSGHTDDNHPYPYSPTTGEDEIQMCSSQPSTSTGVTKMEDGDFDLINIVKEDLKHNIHKRRQQKGLGDIKFDEDDYPRTYQLTATEERKRELRKERNRIAATKCREKKRRMTDELLYGSEELDKKNRDLREQADELREEKEYLTQLLKEHLAVCPNQHGGCRR